MGDIPKSKHWILWAGLLLAGRALAVENASPPPRRFVLVGVISDDEPVKAGKDKVKVRKGVAVLKDLDNKVTLTIETGTSIPYSPFVVQRIDRQLVVLRDGDQLLEVRHDGSSFEEDKEKDKGERDSKGQKVVSMPDIFDGNDEYDPEFEDVYASELESDLWFFDSLRRQEGDEDVTIRRRADNAYGDGVSFGISDKALPRNSLKVDETCVGNGCDEMQVTHRIPGEDEALENDRPSKD